MDDPIAVTRKAFVSALHDGDPAAAASVYTPDARMLPPAAEPVEGRVAIASYWQAGVDAGLTDVSFEAQELRRFDGVAYEIGRYSLRLEPADGTAVVDRGHYVLVHERQDDGSWRFAVEMFNPDTPPSRGGER